jgi:RNA polymerase sigma-70 factor (ECF subfamily)
VGEETDEFAEVYKAYFDDIFKAVYHRIPNRQIAEDITQDTFFAAFRRGEEFLRHPEPKLWLFRTAHNKILEVYRKAKRWGMEPLELHPELAEQDCYYGEVELNLAALEAIGKNGWRVIKAYHVFGNTISEIAESESVTENNMRVRLFRVRKKLEDRMKCWIF